LYPWFSLPSYPNRFFQITLPVSLFNATIPASKVPKNTLSPKIAAPLLITSQQGLIAAGNLCPYSHILLPVFASNAKSLEYDPVKGEIVWSHKEKLPLWAGVLATKGGLIFTGTGEGFLKAFDAKTGKEVFKFQTGSGIISCPITWEEDGEQYIGIASGYGGAVPLWGGGIAKLTKTVSQGGSFWVFKLKK